MRNIIICIFTILILICNFYNKNSYNFAKTIDSIAIAADLYDDTDGDGIFDDGDNSGIILDNPCTGGETSGCDDNCTEVYNPEQIDLDSDGFGDICECEADFEGDGDVDAVDSTTFVNNFGRGPWNRPCIPEDPCEADFDGNGGIDASDLAILLEDFGRNKWNSPCPPCLFGFIGEAPPAPENPPEPRFTDHGDGTVTDNLTGLIWTKDAQQIVWKHHWDTAVTLCSDLIYPETDGYDDWRLPTLDELQSIMDPGNNHPALPTGHPFQNTLPFVYWTSTPYETVYEHVHYVFMTTGSSYYHCKAAYGYIWPVRGGN